MRDDLDAQDELRGLLLARLLAQGVRRVDYSSQDFYEAFTADYPTFAEFDGVFDDMLAWLKAERFIRFETTCEGTMGETCVVGLQATSKAISLLDKQVPETGAKARDLIRPTGDKSDDAANFAKFGNFVGGLLAGFATSLG